MGFTRSHFFQSQYFQAADVAARPMTLTIKGVAEELVGTGSDRELKCAVSVLEDSRRLLTNKTNFVTMEEAFGEDCDDWPGHRITLVRAFVDFQGRRVPALRVEIPAPPTKRSTRSTSPPPVEEPDDDAADGADAEEEWN